MPCLLDLPEEILEIVILLVSTSGSSAGNSAEREALQPLLSLHSVLYRIGAAFCYRRISLSDCETAYLLWRTLDEAPHYAKHVRVLHADAIYPSLPFILHVIASAQSPIDNLSFALDAPPRTQLAIYAQKHLMELEPWSSGASAPDLTVARALASVLPQLKPGPREFIISHNRPPLPRDREHVKVLDAAIAETLPAWDGLRSMTIAFRFPSDSAIPGGLARTPHLERISTPLPVVWHESLLVAAENPALKRLAVTFPRLKARARAGPVFVPVPGRVEDSWSAVFPAAAAATNASSTSTTAPLPTTSFVAKGKSRPSLADRLRGPVEVVSPFGTFHDRTERVLESEEHPLSRKQVLHDGQGGFSAWLIEARNHPRLLELMLAESDAAEKARDLQLDVLG
ncbi:hypothetical protein PENSPDRAFT_686634 [Peniophora sp. CONT]|nr:hypothetical protein PENSPDRAFT_686634 [Peniophora sp. CONT]